MELDIQICECPAFGCAEDSASRADYIKHRNNLQLRPGYCPYCGEPLVKGREKITGVVVRIRNPKYARGFESEEFDARISFATLKRLLEETVI